MNAPLSPITPAKAAEIAHEALSSEQLERQLELNLRAIKSRLGFTSMMRAIDKAVRNITRAQGDIGDGWVG